MRAGTRRVGTPSPTGTPWPSLPHMPGLPMAKSWPTASMLASTAGPLPMRLPSRIGSVICAVLDEVRLGHAEHEVAGGGVHLAAAEVGHVHAVGGAGDDVVGLVGTGQHVGVGHPHHRQVLVALPAAVARAGPALLARAQEVVHVVGEDAVLDEHVALGQRALVVDREGAPLLGHGAVVDQRDARVGHPLARRGRRTPTRPWPPGRPRGRGRRPRGTARRRHRGRSRPAWCPTAPGGRPASGAPARRPRGRCRRRRRCRTARSRRCGRATGSRSACRCRPTPPP